MHFQIVDTETAYRHLLAAPDATTREAIFRKELIEPFAGLVQFFGGEGMAMFAQWGMSPEQYGGEYRARKNAVLEILAAHNVWGRAAQALEKGAAAFARYTERIPLERVVFGLLLADLSTMPLQRGYSGFGAIPGWVMTIYDQPDAYNLERVEAATVHELHHTIYGAAFPNRPMIASVGEYMIGEGLAESFAAELYGEDKIGFFVTDFDQTRLEETRQIMKGALDASGFDVVRGYIFGDVIARHMGLPLAGVPDYAGYAIGYQVVQAYLKRTGKSVAEATFVPAREIIAESRFFDEE